MMNCCFRLGGTPQSTPRPRSGNETFTAKVARFCKYFFNGIRSHFDSKHTKKFYEENRSVIKSSVRDDDFSDPNKLFYLFFKGAKACAEEFQKAENPA